MATFTPKPRALSSDELAAVRCDLRSGIEPTLETALRMLATIEALQTALLWRQGREGSVAPGQIGVEVVSRVPEMPESIGRRA